MSKNDIFKAIGAIFNEASEIYHIFHSLIKKMNDFFVIMIATNTAIQCILSQTKSYC